MKLSRMIVGVSLALCLAGCGKKVAQGQVVAIVDGAEVTRRELATEPEAASLSAEDANGSLSGLLGGVIDRKLAVAEARRLELDRSPAYLAQSKRVEEVMLSRTLFDRWAAELPVPDDRAVAQYVARNPQRFDGRKLLLVDRIEAKAIPGLSEGLKPLQTNDAVAAYLQQAQAQPLQRGQTVIDTATLPLPLYRQLLGVPVGYPVVMQLNDRLVALAVVQVRDAPLPPEQKSEAAAQALRQQAVQDKLAAMRRKASITYQQGYRPTNPPAAGPSKLAPPGEPVALR